MSTNIDTQTIARIVGRIKAASGKPIDEAKLSAVLHNSLSQLKEQNPQKYLEVITDLSEKMEAMAAEISAFAARK